MIRTRELVVKVEIKDMNKLAVRLEPYSEQFLYAFQLYRNGEMIDRVLYSEQNETVFWLSQSGEYTVRACLKQPENSIATISEPIQFVHPGAQIPAVPEKKVSLFEKVIIILKEIISNFGMMCRVAQYDYKLVNKDAYLGKIWNILTPLLQIGTYWLVFGMGIRGGREMGEHPFIVWMLCGLVPWFFINHSITKGASSIYNKAATVTKMRYPIATVPIGAVVTGFMEHIMLLLILLITLLGYGYYPTLHYLNLIYYIVYNVVFLCSLALITSVLTMLARDFEKVLANVVRLVFYITPILWSMENMPEIYQDILNLNPVLYVVNGFRDSLLYGVDFWEYPERIVIFWAVNICLLMFGCSLQYKYRKKFNDLV